MFTVTNAPHIKVDWSFSDAASQSEIQEVCGEVLVTPAKSDSPGGWSQRTAGRFEPCRRLDFSVSREKYQSAMSDLFKRNGEDVSFTSDEETLWWPHRISRNTLMHNVLKVFSFQTQRNPPPKKTKKKPNIHSDCLLRLFCKRKSISSSLGCSYTISLFLKSFCSSSINSFPFHCRNNTRGPSQRQLCYWLLSFKQWWSSMSEGSIPAAYENDVRVCAVQWELPRPISCIHHHAPMVVRSPVNATVFTHSGSLSTRLY